MADDNHSTLIRAIRHRSEKLTEFWHGISTADQYVRTLEKGIGMDRCYRFLSRGNNSYDDVLKRASKLLSYTNEDMELIEEGCGEGCGHCGRCKEEKKASPLDVGKLALPKNTLMAFTHVLTSSRKDRDGDVLHSDGAILDPKMLLLWQHVHTMPIGRMIAVREKNSKRLVVVSAIVDMNELCHDSAVMVDNGMGRFSHGFRAISFDKNKEMPDGEERGFEVHSFEIMEESLVSVPANVDAEVDEVLLDLVEGRKLTSPLMKEVGRGIRERRNVKMSMPIDLNIKVSVESSDENKRAGGGEEGAGGKGPASAPEEADVKAARKADEEKPKDDEVECPDCGEEVTPDEDGKCPECGAEIEGGEKAKKPSDDESDEGDHKPITCPDCGKKVEPNEDGNCPKCGSEMRPKGKSVKKELETKAGRVLNKSNEGFIRKAKDHVDDVAGEEYIKRGHAAQLREASSHLGTVLKAVEVMVEEGPADASANPQGEGDTLNQAASNIEAYTVRDAMALVLTKAEASERRVMMAALKAIEDAEDAARAVDEFKSMVGIKAKPKEDEEEPEEDDEKPKKPAKKPEDDEEEKPGKGPLPWDKGNLHKEFHKGNEFMLGSDARKYLEEKCGASCKGHTENSVDCAHTGKEVAAFMIKAGFQHKYFQEEDDQKAKKRVEAFTTKGMKATAIHTIGNKACSVFMSRAKKG